MLEFNKVCYCFFIFFGKQFQIPYSMQNCSTNPVPNGSRTVLSAFSLHRNEIEYH